MEHLFAGCQPLALRTPDGSTGMHLWDMRAVDLPAAPRLLEELDPGRAVSSAQTGSGWRRFLPERTLMSFTCGTSPRHRPLIILCATKGESGHRRFLARMGGGWRRGVGDPTIKLWDLKAPDPTSSPHVLRRHRGPVRSLAFSADGHRLVTGANDGLALVWDLNAAVPSANPKSLEGGGGTSLVRTVAISSDGRYR